MADETLGALRDASPGIGKYRQRGSQSTGEHEGKRGLSFVPFSSPLTGGAEVRTGTVLDSSQHLPHA